MGTTAGRLASICKCGNAVVMLFAAAYLFLIPGGIVTCDLLDPNIRGEGIPRAAIRHHRSLTPKYARWARERLASDRGMALSTDDISGTEWPLFGSVFYLWATESLQDAWEQDNSICPRAPKEYARGAVEAAAQLVIDPNQAGWVQEHWGEDYLHEENVFYRMLGIAALTAHYRLTGDGRHLATLRERVESLAQELDESPYGLLDDYPGECYPADVLTAIACIRRADAVLGTDHSAFAERAVRGFQGDLLDEHGLVPYSADAWDGSTLLSSRGCGNSYVSLFAPEIWPEKAAEWYGAYEKHFWQCRWTLCGFREFPREDAEHDWYLDVDAGPVAAGHGTAASAFGVGAARANGRFDHAYPLTAEMLVARWPLPGGTMAMPRILSNATDARYLGEAAILFVLTRQPAATVEIRKGGALPAFVYIMLAAYFGLGALLTLLVVLSLRRWRRPDEPHAPWARTQFATWALLAVGGAAAAASWQLAPGLLMLLAAQLLPRVKKR